MLLTKPRMKATLPGLGKRGPWRWPLDLTCLVCPVPKTYVGMQSCIPAMMWWWCVGSANSYPDEVLGSTPQTWLNGLALSQVLRLTLVRCAKSTIERYKSTFVRYISRRPTKTLSIQLRKCTDLGIGTSSPAKEIWLNLKYHLGGKFTARLSS